MDQDIDTSGMPSRETVTGWRSGRCEPHEVQQSQGQGPAPGSGQPTVSVQTGE